MLQMARKIRALTQRHEGPCVGSRHCIAENRSLIGIGAVRALAQFDSV